MIYCTVGTTGSGKSTWVKQFVKCKDAYVIDGDKLRLMLFSENYTYDPAVEIYLKKCAVDLANQMHFLGKDVIIDDADWFLSDEDRFGLFKSEDRVTWVVFQFPSKELVIKRRTEEGRGIPVEKWLEVWENHKKRFKIPQTNNKIFAIV